MHLYLFHGLYTLEGVRGLLKNGSSSRQAHFEENGRNLGGQVEAIYYAFGGNDVYAIVDLPDNVSSAAISLALNAGGGFQVSTIVLLTPEEIGQATLKATTVNCQPPGQST